MKIIFSRKGFDSSSGGCPSPLLPDGKLLSLPIPDKSSLIKYSQLHYGKFNFGEIVSSLTKNKIMADYCVHLDPDIDSKYLPREKGWNPIFGQAGMSQSHLQKMGVEVGDIFLFFGLFRKIVINGISISWSPGSKPFHALWGWLQIGEIIKVDSTIESKMPWAKYHPHVYNIARKNNCLYKSSKSLVISNKALSIPGAGTFNNCYHKQILSSDDSNKVTCWSLPKWIYPSSNKKPLSFHSDLSRWCISDNTVLLQTVGRGQEFVLDCNDYVESYDWIINLMENSEV